VGRVTDWLFGTVEPLPAVTAGAATVALAHRGAPAPTMLPWGFGPPLEPFVTPDGAPPWWDRDTAMTLPTISRARDLIVSAVSALPFTFWTIDAAQVPAVERRTPPLSWAGRPDPNRTRQWLLAWTSDDLVFHGVAHWEVTSRYATTFPATFQRIAPGNLTPTSDPAFLVVTDEVTGRQRRVRVTDVIEFLSPLQGLLSNGWRAISIALQLDAAADRFAGTEVPAGVLEEQDGSEDMSPAELTELAETFSMARRYNTTAALNKHVRYRETTVDASQMQLVEGRTYQALELARLGNIPPYLVGAPAGTGMTYQNGQQARQDLVDFGAAPIIGCIEQTLSGPNVTARNTAVRLDLNAWLRNPFTTPDAGNRSPNDLQVTDTDRGDDPAGPPLGDPATAVPT
jgi:hypothetical protein